MEKFSEHQLERRLNWERGFSCLVRWLWLWNKRIPSEVSLFSYFFVVTSQVVKCFHHFCCGFDGFFFFTEVDETTE